MDDDVRVADNVDARRYEAYADGELAGFADYEISDGLITFVHTEVDDRFEGRGVGSTLARLALDDVRARGDRKVVPKCPFIKGWIEEHEEYLPLVHEFPEG
jgi:predicted GNAT family acetyltransferase